MKQIYWLSGMITVLIAASILQTQKLASFEIYAQALKSCDDKIHQIAICHDNNGIKDYSKVFTDLDSLTKNNGHIDHNNLFDIVPPFSCTKGDETFSFPGRIGTEPWTSIGQQIIDNNCVTPAPSASPTATPTATPSASPTATPTATPTVTPEPSFSPTPTPTTTPSPTPAMSSTKDFYAETWCDGHITLHFTFKDDGKGANNKSVQFSYNNESKDAKTNTDGKARVDFGYAGEKEAKVAFDGESMSTTVKAAQNCSTTGSVLGMSTDPGIGGGQVLGASTMAGTGVFEDIVMNTLGVLGSMMTLAGARRYGKKN